MLGKHSTAELHPSHTPRVSHPASLTVRNENNSPGAAAGLGTTHELPPHSKDIVAQGAKGANTLEHAALVMFKDCWKKRRGGSRQLGYLRGNGHKVKYLGLFGSGRFSVAAERDRDRDVT